MTPGDVPEGPLILDTDVASFIRTGRPPGEPFKPLIRGHVLCLSFATVAELRAGVLIIKLGPARRRPLEAFIRRHVVLPADDLVATRWAEIHAAVRGQVDVNDEWTAACALAQADPLPVVTGNLKHFQRIAARFPALVVVHPSL